MSRWIVRLSHLFDDNNAMVSRHRGFRGFAFSLFPGSPNFGYCFFFSFGWPATEETYVSGLGRFRGLVCGAERRFLSAPTRAVHRAPAGQARGRLLSLSGSRRICAREDGDSKTDHAILLRLLAARPDTWRPLETMPRSNLWAGSDG